MKPLNSIIAAYKSDMEDVENWCKEVYDNHFQNYFTKQRKLYIQMQDAKTPISDGDLTKILTDVPLDLFMVSEQLSRVQTQYETLKLRIKERMNEIETSPEVSDMSKTARRDYAEKCVIPDNILLSAYGLIIDRVEHEISFSRELIMGAKKIWDSRRKTEASNPISEVAPEDLPEYSPTVKRNSYVK